MMLTFFKHWDHWWQRKSPPHLLALFRVIFGAYLLFYWGLKLPYVDLYFSTAGLVLPDKDLAILQVPSPTVAYALFLTFHFCLFLFTIGAFTRSASFLCACFSLYYWFLSLHLFGTSFDRLYITTLLVLSFSGAGKTFSFEMYWKKGSIFAWEAINILPQRLIAVQITATYLGVGLQKWVLPGWVSGEVLSYSFISRWGSDLAYKVARLNMPLWVYDGMVLTVKVFETLLPFGLWNRKYQWWFFAGTAIFHISITFLLSIWWFLILIPANIVFLSPEDVYEFLKARSRGKIA